MDEYLICKTNSGTTTVLTAGVKEATNAAINSGFFREGSLAQLQAASPGDRFWFGGVLIVKLSGKVTL